MRPTQSAFDAVIEESVVRDLNRALGEFQTIPVCLVPASQNNEVICAVVGDLIVMLPWMAGELRTTISNAFTRYGKIPSNFQKLIDGTTRPQAIRDLMQDFLHRHVQVGCAGDTITQEGPSAAIVLGNVLDAPTLTTSQLAQRSASMFSLVTGFAGPEIARQTCAPDTGAISTAMTGVATAYTALQGVAALHNSRLATTAQSSWVADAYDTYYAQCTAIRGDVSNNTSWSDVASSMMESNGDSDNVKDKTTAEKRDDANIERAIAKERVRQAEIKRDDAGANAVISAAKVVTAQRKNDQEELARANQEFAEDNNAYRNAQDEYTQAVIRWNAIEVQYKQLYAQAEEEKRHREGIRMTVTAVVGALGSAGGFFAGGPWAAAAIGGGAAVLSDLIMKRFESECREEFSCGTTTCDDIAFSMALRYGPHYCPANDDITPVPSYVLSAQYGVSAVSTAAGDHCYALGNAGNEKTPIGNKCELMQGIAQCFDSRECICSYEKHISNRDIEHRPSGNICSDPAAMCTGEEKQSGGSFASPMTGGTPLGPQPLPHARY